MEGRLSTGQTGPVTGVGRHAERVPAPSFKDHEDLVGPNHTNRQGLDRGPWTLHIKTYRSTG